MELIFSLLAAALVGGVVLASIRFFRPRAASSGLPVVESGRDLGADAINMSHIRVSGLGGLGLVAMAFGVAWAIPRIGETVVIGFGLGACLALLWIVRRQRTGPMPSSGRGVGAHTMLVADSGERAPNENHRPDTRVLVAAPVPGR